MKVLLIAVVLLTQGLASYKVEVFDDLEQCDSRARSVSSNPELIGFKEKDVFIIQCIQTTNPDKDIANAVTNR
jgi:hypothetical protein